MIPGLKELPNGAFLLKMDFSIYVLKMVELLQTAINENAVRRENFSFIFI